MKYHEWQKKRNLTFDWLYEEHYNLKQIQEFQDANWKKNHIQKELEKRLKAQMKMFYKERKRNNIQRIERSIYEDNNNENENLNMLLQAAMKEQESSKNI